MKKAIKKPAAGTGGIKDPNKPANVSKKASVKFTGPQSKAPKGAIPSKKKGGAFDMYKSKKK